MVTRGDAEEPPGSAPSALISSDVHSILYYASLAPSGHNTQPWSVRLGHEEMWIGTERSRWLPGVDPTNREATLSLGAFLENLIVAAPAYGYVADYETNGPSTAGAPSKEGRYLAEATLEANRLQTARDDAQAELADWMRWTPEDGRAHRNGFTPESLEIAGVAGWYVRHFMNRDAVLGKRFRAQGLDRVRQQLASYGGWMVIVTEDDTVDELINAGRRCERMWLETRAHSIAVHPMSQVLEESPLKEPGGRRLDDNAADHWQQDYRKERREIR
jgi:hypothetical protein